MKRKLYFPIFIDLNEKNILIVGAGKVARRRLMALIDFCGNITVVAPEVLPDILELAKKAENLEVIQRPYEPSDLDGRDMVIVATADVPLNIGIVHECRERKIVVNTSHDKSMCDFYFPGLVRKDSIVVGVTSSGSDHRKAKKVTDNLKRYFV